MGAHSHNIYPKPGYRAHLGCGHRWHRYLYFWSGHSQVALLLLLQLQACSTCLGLQLERAMSC